MLVEILLIFAFFAAVTGVMMYTNVLIDRIEDQVWDEKIRKEKEEKKNA